ncbi:hypothetical protein SEA_ALLEYCAT_69 [Mycobacterium phage AlleyCat]|uniref:Uncharacterized protein n=3 Tax=Kratiovirus larva TaxID=1056831 RepID=A0A221J7A1_9CAUD|nr:hypothetical protein CL76_gp34 [Mycobacterium phage Larva]AEL19716.1 hypothetical protein LARVA_68 [Mycobacterium phage Larva]ASM62575.1 hypothetical protein SEA_ALLEYCAT_69 [Mycobacterium phage AlleyCat]QQV92669.1 hypothetical protein SEA_PSYCHO_67 [Mycobacterium phage Psycho]WAB09750.1 hypothetical protein SEA_DADOSKY_69 [Mycobacterium phage Dadosky]
MKIGDLFTRTDIVTTPCEHCGDPIVDCDGRLTHFVIADNGAKTAWGECQTIVRGHHKPAGDQAALFGNA